MLFLKRLISRAFMCWQMFGFFSTCVVPYGTPSGAWSWNWYMIENTIGSFWKREVDISSDHGRADFVWRQNCSKMKDSKVCKFSEKLRIRISAAQERYRAHSTIFHFVAVLAIYKSCPAAFSHSKNFLGSFGLFLSQKFQVPNIIRPFR